MKQLYYIVATDILITVIVYNTSPPPLPLVSCSMLVLACCWLQTRAVWDKIHDGCQKTGSVHVHDPIWRDHKFHDCIKPLDVYDDLGLFQHFWFSRCELLEVTEDFNNDMQYLASAKESLSALGGHRCRSCTCICFIVLHQGLFFPLLFFSNFIVHWCEN